MAQQSTSVGEHRVHVATHGAGRGEVATTAPERRLNCFVRSVAVIERVGNALGTLAFTWATVVLLGGYPNELRIDSDFWFATAIFFLEAARMFSGNNRMDYRLFFGTGGSIRLIGYNGLILAACLSGPACIIVWKMKLMGIFFILFLAIPVIIGRFVCHGAPRLLVPRYPLRRAISLWSPMVAIIMMVLSFITYTSRNGFSVGLLTAYLVLLVVVLLLTISRMRFPRIIRLVDRALGRKQEFWRRLVITMCMVAAISMAFFIFAAPIPGAFWFMVMMEACAFILLSFGNLQIPAAIVRVVLPLFRFTTSQPDDVNNPATVNLASSLDIFYEMVLGQGALYAAACMLQIFSSVPRRSLVHRGGFRGQWGVESVDLYYEYALDKCMERDLVAPRINLCSFAVDYLNSDSAKRQLHGIRTIHVLLQRDPTRTRLLGKLNASAETMGRLVRVLNWTGQEDRNIRFFAAKAIDELAKSLLVVTVPGIAQNVSLLLDYGNNGKRGSPLLDTDDEQKQDQEDYLLVNATDNPMEGPDVVPDTQNMLATQDRSTQQIGVDDHKFWMFRWCQQIFDFWSVPPEQPLTEQDLLPALGMSILGNLAAYDQSNCEEISKVTGLIPKITRFTRFCTGDTEYTDAQQKVLLNSSLKLLHRLTSIDGEIGITLRQMISNHPFLLRNLSEILGDSTSGHELLKLALGIIRNLAVVDASTRQAIGQVQLIMSRLMHAFLTPPTQGAPSTVTDDERMLRKVAGQALALLAMDSVSNCLAMLRETGYTNTFIKDLTGMIYLDRYRYVAASLLRSVCLHARPELQETDLKELSYSLRQVLNTIFRAEGAELETLIGLSSQISVTIPEEFVRELGRDEIQENFVKLLVDKLNANMEPSAKCPRIRRLILEQAISLMTHDSRYYVNYFKDCHMVEALLMVEKTISEAESYCIFLGDVGLMEAGEPLSSLVAKAKQLLGVH